MAGKGAGLDDFLESRRSAFDYYARLRRVKAYVEQCPGEDLSLSAAAEVAGLEAKYFSAYFRRKTGLCFSDWVARIRVAQAQAMMQARDYSVTEVAYSVGYKDVRTFQRAFKRLTGMTPRSFRARMRPQ